MLAWSLVDAGLIGGIVAAGAVLALAVVLVRRGLVVRIRDERGDEE